MYSSMYRSAKRFFWPDERKKLRLLRELERTQWLSGLELEEWQLTKIQQLVNYAYEHVPYYRERYRREGIQPEDIKSLEDFRALPILTREDVNNHLDELVSPDFGGQLRMSQTGGSTGEPVSFYLEESWYHWSTALRRRGRAWYGVQDGDKEAWVWGAERDLVHWSWKRRLKARLVRRRDLNAFDLTEAKMQAFAEMLVRWQPTMLRSGGQALPLFARFVKEQGIVGIRPKLIETTAEKMTAPQRQLLEDVFGCPVADYYSTRELGTIAYPCEMGRLHVCETRYMELVAADRPVRSGQMGEVILTSLNQYAMPFIRYKVDDLAVQETGSCPCGRGLPVLQEIVGKTRDLIATTDGQFVHGDFFSRVLYHRPNVVRFQVYQPNMQLLEVRLVCKQDPDDAWLEEIRSEIQDHMGESMKIAMQVVDHIELTPAGKHRFVISDVTHDLTRKV